MIRMNELYKRTDFKAPMIADALFIIVIYKYKMNLKENGQGNRKQEEETDNSKLILLKWLSHFKVKHFNTDLISQ